MLRSLRTISLSFALLAVPAWCNQITLPGGSLSIPGIPGVASYVFTGTVDQNSLLSFVAGGGTCLQVGGTYCTNAAGVITTAGTSPVGTFTTFNGSFGGAPSVTYTYGALLFGISGIGVAQMFQPTAVNGLGSGAPPTSLSFTGSLSSLGFGAFSVVNPTITFYMADTLFPDNTQQFSLRELAVTGTPEPASFVLIGAGLLGAAALRRLKR